MLSGVKAQVGIKIYGDDLDLLRKKAEEVQNLMRGVPGVTDLMIEPQVIIPQLRIELDRNQLSQYGLSVDEVNDYVQTAMNGAVVSEVLEGMRTFDLLVRMQNETVRILRASSDWPFTCPKEVRLLWQYRAHLRSWRTQHR